MASRLPLLLAGFLLAAAGVSANQITAIWPDGTGHTHSDHLQHRAAGFGMSLLSHLNLGEAIGEVDVKTGTDGKTWVLVALLGGGFALVDGTDPANPVLKSKSRFGGYGADAKLSDDANTVYLSIQGWGSSAACSPPVAGMYTSTPEQLACGVQIWDATDKALPRFVATLPSSSGGSHMTDYERLHGLPTVAMAAQGGPDGIPIATWLSDKELRVVGRADAGYVHDMTLAPDPLSLLGLTSLLIVANWDSGVTIFDITNPSDMFKASDPPRLGAWPPPTGSGGNIHTVMPMALDGKRIIVAQQENFGQSVVSKLFFLDATDFGNIRLLGTWQNPDGKLANNGFVRWSTHNFNIADGKLYLAHYHGGVLVLDVSSMDKITQPGGPPILANYLPTMPRVSGSFGSDVPYSWDALPYQGTIWVTDINTGLYAVKLD